MYYIIKFAGHKHKGRVHGSGNYLMVLLYCKYCVCAGHNMCEKINTLKAWGYEKIKVISTWPTIILLRRVTILDYVEFLHGCMDSPFCVEYSDESFKENVDHCLSYDHYYFEVFRLVVPVSLHKTRVLNCIIKYMSEQLIIRHNYDN